MRAVDAWPSAAQRLRRWWFVPLLPCLLLVSTLASVATEGSASPTAGMAMPAAAETLATQSLWAEHPSPASPAVQTRNPGAQLWVWHLGDPLPLVGLAQRSHVSTLLVWVSPGFSRDTVLRARLSTLRGLAHEHQIAVHALCGDTSWVARPAVAGQWASEVARSGFFSGVHLDIEPHSLPEWRSETTRLATGLLDALNAATAARLPVSADIPSWYHRIHYGSSTLDIAVLRSVTQITIMAYNNTTAGILASAQPEVMAAARAGKKAYIGINIGPDGGDVASTTLLGQTAKQIRTVFDSVDKNARTWNGYAGLAIHDAEHLAEVIG